MIEGRRAVLVQDEFEIKTPCEVAWGMTTDAEIDIKEKTVAVLKLKGKELTARLLSPKTAPSRWSRPSRSRRSRGMRASGGSW